MQTELQALMITAITVAWLHTVSGPDHYLPFIALAKAKQWSFKKMLSWTVVCGSGHVLSSVVLGLTLTGIGWSLTKITGLEEIRGSIAGWAMLIFGLCYSIWGLYRAFGNVAHKHFDTYEDGMYVYQHRHGNGGSPAEKYKVTPWVMFIIFLLGPCEPMIPLLAFPAAKNSWEGMLLLIIVYTIFTLLTMMLMVTLGYYGISLLTIGKLERYAHVLGGFTLLLCGVGMVFLSW